MSRVHYIEIGPYPGFVGIVFDEAVYRREMKRLGVNPVPTFCEAGSNASTKNFVHPSRGEMNLVCFDRKKARGRALEQILGTLVHEAVHVKQNLFKWIGEKKPGAEQEAYFIGFLAQRFMYAYRKHAR